MKKNKTIWIAGSVVLALALFVGCGEHAGEKEFNKANDARKKGDLVRARTLFEKSIRKTSSPEKKSVAWNKLGLILWELNEVEAAAEAFSKSCGLADALTEANQNLGMALFHSGRLDEAEVALNNVLGNDPNNVTAQSMLGLIEMKQKEWSNASRKINRSAQLAPNDPALKTTLALAALHLNRSSDSAVSQLKQIRSSHPDYAPAAFNLAVIYDQWQGNKRAATSWYNEYISLAGPDGSQVEAAHKALDRLSGNASRTQPSLVGPTNPDAAARFMAEGSRLHAAKNYTDALAQYKKAIQADPRQKSAHYNMGLAHYALAQYAPAAQACLNALQQDAQFADARYMLALSYVQQKKWADAEREAKALNKQDPTRSKTLLQYIAESQK